MVVLRQKVADSNEYDSDEEQSQIGGGKYERWFSVHAEHGIVRDADSQNANTY